MRTNIVLDSRLVAKAMKKAGVRTMRETIHIALRAYVSKPDYDQLLALAGSGTIADGYDPKTADRSPFAVAEPAPLYRRQRVRSRRPRRG